MDTRLRLETERQYLTLAGKALPQDMKDKLHNSDRMKNYILNTFIFPSLANVIFFLESVARDPNLHELFRDDLLDLMTGIGKQQHTQEQPTTEEAKKTEYEHTPDLYSDSAVARLTNSLLSARTDEGEIKGAQYRLVFADIMQRILTTKLREDLSKQFDVEEMQELLKPMAQGAKVLMKFCASWVPAEDRDPDRWLDVPRIEAKEDPAGNPVVRRYSSDQREIDDKEFQSYLSDRRRRRRKAD
jgi:hypothetical protein